MRVKEMFTDAEPDVDQELTRSYLKLRKYVGLIGLLLPVWVLVWARVANHRVLTSISQSYYTASRGFFVGGLCAIGLLLLSYNYRRLDNVLTNIACVFAVLVALCPTPYDNAFNGFAAVHYACATLLFCIFGVMSLCRFPLTSVFPEPPPDRYFPRRQRLFRASGLTIFGTIVVAIAAWLLGKPFHYDVSSGPFLFWVETVIVWAFGLSWTVKGGWYLGLRRWLVAD